MSQPTLRLLLIPMLVAACATGRDWKVQTFTASAAPDNTYSTAKKALADVGFVDYADEEIMSISGECQSKVVAAITIKEADSGQCIVTIKSRMDVAGNMVGGEGGNRQKCIDAIADRVVALGIPLTPQQP